MEEEMKQMEFDFEEIACERCGYWPCICSDPEFELCNSIALNQATEVD
jgi:hypothetical protein